MPSHGEVREDGYIYWGMCGPNQSGKRYEQWFSPDAWARSKIKAARRCAKFRAKECGVPFNITVDDAIDAYPADGKCPVLGIPLEWNRERLADNSPSLDRVIPELGYVKGNISFISQRANRLKSNSTLFELERVVSYMRSRL